MATILIVEDDAPLAQLTATVLRQAGHTVTINGGYKVVEQVLAEVPDLLVLDVELPEETGFSVCRRLRPDYSNPILMLTGRTDQTDEIIGWEMGADDYLGKPVTPRILVFRVAALLRRLEATSNNQGHKDADLEISLTRRKVRVRGEPLSLHTSEFELLWFLVEHLGRPVSRDAYFREIRGIEYDGRDRTFDTRMSKLRKKLVAHGLPVSRIVTVRGVGYQLTAV